MIRSWNAAHWIELPRRVGAKIAHLIGAQPPEVICADSTSINLFKVLATALRLQASRPQVSLRERKVILSEKTNFPTDLYVAQGVIDLLGQGHELRLVEFDEVADAIDDRTAVVMLTHVNFRTGAMHDMSALTSRAHGAGALTVWDLSHSAGAVPVDLNAASSRLRRRMRLQVFERRPGCAGVRIRCQPSSRRDCRRHLRTTAAGWLGHHAPFEFVADYRPAASIDRYAVGTPSIIALSALEVGVDTVLAAGIDALRAKSIALTQLFIELVEQRCAAHGLSLASPRDADASRQSGLLFASARLCGDAGADQRGVIGDFRAPDIVRFGFAPLYVGYADVWDAVQALHQVLAEREWQRSRVSDARGGDAMNDLRYGDYLALDSILNAQHPRSSDPNELLFIIQHQTSELWMKLALHELRAARDAIRADDLPPAFKMLARVSRIMEQLVHAWDVLATMTPSEYSAIRPYLSTSSGFQSWQYREIEFVLGNKASAMLKPHEQTPIHSALQSALDAPSLYDEAIHLLARRGFAIDRAITERDVREPHASDASVEQAWLAIYRAPRENWDLYELAEELVDLEDAFRLWRFRHVTTVERIIGFKTGTGGTSGVAYLRKMLDVVLFPELWKVRTDL